MIRERCSCGAEFETDEEHAIKLLRAWRKQHRHEPQTPGRDTDTSASIELATDPRTPELHIGFRNDPFEDQNK